MVFLVRTGRFFLFFFLPRKCKHVNFYIYINTMSPILDSNDPRVVYFQIEMDVGEGSENLFEGDPS